MEFFHATSIQIRFNDIDMMGHVTNMIHLAYCDNARIKYFNEVLEEKIENNEESLVIVNLNIDFLKPIFLDENIEIKSKIVKIGNKSIQMLQHIVNADTSEIKTIVQSVISGFNYVNQISIILPERWKDKIVEFEKEVEFKYS